MRKSTVSVPEHCLLIYSGYNIHLHSTPEISNTDISKFPLISKNLVLTYFLFTFQLLLSQTAGAGRVVRWCWVNFQCRGVLLIWVRVRQGPTALTVGADGGCLDIFTLVYHFSFLSPAL